ncbi:hypothetical protein [Engelhardtia mirabilis]|uniref:SLA1 homology domain-containing protein n=1 Tax=Engelhardtia mirabilis TaxID=2528011 RepID=A0A518BLG9_9BACT|nr:hypothetical protein Pla133_29060 [Planctomycetes bacterium Pla133]QDV02143.1 hypothetical protein Pla86_29050 [Planctomycetes bacterium Pla86]
MLIASLLVSLAASIPGGGSATSTELQPSALAVPVLQAAVADPAPPPEPATGRAAVVSSVQEEGSNRRSPKIEMPADLPTEPLVYERTWSRYRVDVGNVVADSEHHGAVTMTVLEVDDKGNRVLRWQAAPAQWTRELNTGSLIDQAADKGVAELRTGLSYDIVISPKYRTMILDDAEAAAAAAEGAVERAVREIDAGNYFHAIKERARSTVRSAFATPELIEYTLLEEPTILFEPLGRTYRMNEDRRWEDFFVNPVGAAPLPALSVLAPVFHDEENHRMEVRWTRELVHEQADAILETDLAALRRRLKDNEAAPSLAEMFAIREETRYLLDMQTGLPLFAERRSLVRIGADERIESVRFVLSGFEASEDLTGPWENMTTTGQASGTAENDDR